MRSKRTVPSASLTRPHAASVAGEHRDVEQCHESEHIEHRHVHYFVWVLRPPEAGVHSRLTDPVSRLELHVVPRYLRVWRAVCSTTSGDVQGSFGYDTAQVLVQCSRWVRLFSTNQTVQVEPWPSELK